MKHLKKVLVAALAVAIAATAVVPALAENTLPNSTNRQTASCAPAQNGPRPDSRGGRQNAQGNGPQGQMPGSMNGSQGQMPGSMNNQQGQLPGSMNGRQSQIPGGMNGRQGQMPGGMNNQQGQMPGGMNNQQGQLPGSANGQQGQLPQPPMDDGNQPEKSEASDSEASDSEAGQDTDAPEAPEDGAAPELPGNGTTPKAPEMPNGGNGQPARAPERIDFSAFVKDGTISQETCDAIEAYLQSNAPTQPSQSEAPSENGDAGQPDLLADLLNAEIITQAEYDAISAAQNQ